MGSDPAALGCYAVELGLLRLLLEKGAISEDEYRGVCEVAVRYTESDIFILP